MSTTISIQPANTESGYYDVHQPLPYPYHVDADTGNVQRQDFWKGDPARLLGFQDGREQRVTLFLHDFVKRPEAAVGRIPVFLRSDGTMFNTTLPITSVAVHETPVASR